MIKPILGLQTEVTRNVVLVSLNPLVDIRPLFETRILVASVCRPTNGNGKECDYFRFFQTNGFKQSPLLTNSKIKTITLSSKPVLILQR